MSDIPAQLYVSFEAINGANMQEFRLEDFPDLQENLLDLCARVYPYCVKVMHNHDEDVSDENITSAFISEHINVVFWSTIIDNLNIWMPDRPFHRFFEAALAQGALPKGSLVTIKTHWASTSAHTALWAEKRKTDHDHTIPA